VPYTNEILQVRLDGIQVRRLLHHRSRPVNSYGFQPRATVSRDGGKLVFTSNYDLSAILGYSSDYTDAYFVDVDDEFVQIPVTRPRRGCRAGQEAAVAHRREAVRERR
jgi:hypothetical protein